MNKKNDMNLSVTLPTNMNNELLALCDLETAISDHNNGHFEAVSVRKQLTETIESILGHSLPAYAEFSRTIEYIRRQSNRVARRSCIVLVRCLAAVEVIPPKEVDANIEHQMVSLLIEFAPDLAKHFKILEKDQTYQNFAKIRGIHVEVVESLRSWRSLPNTASGIIANKQALLKYFSKNYIKAYLSIYGFNHVTASVREMLALLDTIAENYEGDFFDRIENLWNCIKTQEKYIAQNPNFLTLEFFNPLVKAFSEALTTIEKNSANEFKCEIKPKLNGEYIAAKKYPLYEAEREITIRIPMLNMGPGIAKDTKVSIESEGTSISLNGYHDLGDIRKGVFELSIPALVIEPAQSATFQFMVSWRRQDSTTIEERIFECTIEAQRPDISWEKLKYEEPYSTEVAEGDEFVGRKNKVDVLVKRLLKQKMQSSYISGQKRIGKTSLAKAVIDHVETQSYGRSIFTHYIEWGDVAKPESRESIEALGFNISNFLVRDLPKSIAPQEIRFDGSISALNELANLWKKISPEKKFVIVLDEFDEIHPDMYRFGSLAQTFFANLRTLSSKSNMAFMLIGGENMPFVISAQGDQLNKFVFESLNYFSRETEYSDYEQLVTKPTAGILNWNKDAIGEIFFYTNGHPFYTKLICSKIFFTAVDERDAEVSVREVASAVVRLVDTLDTNSFAHHWKDGIQKTEEEAEIISLNRCRCLVAMGKLLRQCEILDLEKIGKNGVVGQLSSAELKAILTDFVRRGILRESHETYSFCVPFFVSG